MSLKENIAKLSCDFGEENDCTVRALAVALDGDYAQAHSAMQGNGRKKGKGAGQYIWKQAFRDCGFELDDVTNNFDGKTIRTIERELRARGDRRKYMFSVRGHVAAWDGHETIDWAKGRLHRIKTVYHMRPKDEPRQAVRAKVVIDEPESDLTDCTFVLYEPGRSRDGDYRIYIRENGKVRWLNTKYYEYDAEEAAYRAGEIKRCIPYVGVLQSADELKDYYNRPSYRYGEW
jgi:hypothetical protein